MKNKQSKMSHKHTEVVVNYLSDVLLNMKCVEKMLVPIVTKSISRNLNVLFAS